MPAKRKRSSVAIPPAKGAAHDVAVAPTSANSASQTPILPPKMPAVSKASRAKSQANGHVDTNPDHHTGIIDGRTALRASPDADEKGESLEVGKVGEAAPIAPRKTNGVKDAKEDSDSPLSDLEDPVLTPAKKPKKNPTKSSIAAKKGSDEIKAFKAEQAAKKAAEPKIKKEDDNEEWNKRGDPDGDDEGPAEDIDVMRKEAMRPPPVNSAVLPLPWKGRLGYACLNTYLRFSTPPVFSSRTCRIASILEHRHPLKDPSQPEHATKNRPDKTKPASVERGQRYLEEICLANVKDISKMLRWNHKYGIKFLRLSSEMFPFASHAEYGYKLAPFASEALAEAGKVAAELGHRLSTHPGQFTQLGSPRAEVISNAVRDLEYHNEMLSLLALPPQQDRDAVMILHLGGVFGDKEATLVRFRENYQKLPDAIKRRIVLENDDVSYSVHDLLPICEELNIPLCLDFHHNNIIFDSSQLREGTQDIISLFPRIKATWDRKGITQKMHYSEQTPQAVTGRQRRKHNPRPITLPPCANDMDLMIEAKDKEQAVFELMRTFKLPGFETINDIVPFEREDDNRVAPKKAKKKKTKKQVAAEIEEFGQEVEEEEEKEKEAVMEADVGMGGPQNRVYWPVGMEEWLRPKKREIKKKGGDEDEDIFKNPTPANLDARRKIEGRRRKPLDDASKETLRKAGSLKEVMDWMEEVKHLHSLEESDGAVEEKKAKVTKKATPAKKIAKTKLAVKEEEEETEGDEDEDLSMDLSAEETPAKKSNSKAKARPARQSGREKKATNYAEAGGEDDVL